MVGDGEAVRFVTDTLDQAGELLDGRPDQLLIGSLFRIRPEKVLAADQQTATLC